MTAVTFSVDGYSEPDPSPDGCRFRPIRQHTGKDISVLRAIVKTEAPAPADLGGGQLRPYIALEPETRNSAVFNVNTAMSLWNNGLISAATETSDFDIRSCAGTR